MLTYLATSVRAALLAAVLVFSAPTADARYTGADHSQTTARTTSEAPPADRDGTSVEGLLLIVGIVGAVIFFAWVCSRIGDTPRPTMM